MMGHQWPVWQHAEDNERARGGEGAQDWASIFSLSPSLIVLALPTEQTQDKVVLAVEPGAAEGQTGVSPQGVDILNGVFVRIFGMNGLVSGKRNGLRRFGDGHVLRPATAQVHLDASVLLII